MFHLLRLQALRYGSSSKHKFSCRLLTALAIFLLASGVQGAEHQEKISRQFNATNGLVVELENLAGLVTIEGGGNQVTIDAVVVAQGSNDAAAKNLADELEITFKQSGSRLIVRANYPVNRYSTYHYPGDQEKGLSWGGSRTNTRYQGKKVTVVSSSKSKAVTLYADFSLQLPAGVSARVENSVGNIEATGMQGSLTADTGSGNIDATNGSGFLKADTGSGNVMVDDYRGNVDADTGSGNVDIQQVLGNIRADTGSGNVTLKDVEGVQISADTGSGNVDLDDVRGEISLDTGSGSIEGRQLVAEGRLDSDTGSGDINLQGDFSAVSSLSLDTGSGSIEIDATALPAMDLEISTGSGRIDVDIPDLQVQSKDKDYLRGQTYGGGAPFKIETGSGGVRIRG